jgi:ABC-type uncharacterized transport system involved in gliding motility auxiliary subunit
MIEPLLVSSNESFYRTDLDAPPDTQAEGDTPGPHPIAVSVIERDFAANEEISRLVVVGDLHFIAGVERVNGNLDFLMNSFGWLEDQQEVLSIRPKLTLQFPMQTTGLQKLVFAALFVVVIPLGILGAGVIVWLRRRHL